MKKLILATSLIALVHFVFSPMLLASPTSEVLGPTTICDNLKDIADVVRNDQVVTLPQMMLAILKSNPQAFYRNNVNGLIQGSWLYIPTDSEALQFPIEASKTIISKQNQEWSLWLAEMEKANPPIYQTFRPSTCSTETLQSIAHRIRQTTKPVVLLFVEPAAAKNPMADPAVIQAMTGLQQQISSLISKNQDLQNRVDHLEKATVFSNTPLSTTSSEPTTIQVISSSSSTQPIQADTVPKTLPQPESTVFHVISLHLSNTWERFIQWTREFSLPPYFTTITTRSSILWSISLGSLILLGLTLWWAKEKWFSQQPNNNKRPMAISITSPPTHASSKNVPPLMEDYSEYAGSDLAATKLDLAKAYIDMEEWSRAKEILKNVLETGNKAQKMEAENLFREMAKK